MPDKAGSIAARAWTFRLALAARVHGFLLKFGVDLVPVGDRSSHLAQIRQSMSEGLLLNGCEAYQLMDVVKATEAIPGDLAEVGVFRGASAKLICQVKGERKLHLFDTFGGLPAPTAADRGSPFWGAEFTAELDAVRKCLGGYREVYFYRGLFPGTAGPVADRKFSFVHLDVDLYESMKASLEWFYPRLSPGAVVMCHDYVYPGIRAAVHEALAGKPEICIPQPAGAHCLIVKR
ncbi:MAG TPA: TylF/MycF/NovP-related O-methyltransferase [Bryobacteraceae bacterium]|nr:TylF/MycF/NovP-related O-methyltransferase [Bryobacteraceae bacterium]